MINTIYNKGSCWNGCDSLLCQNIKRCKFVNEVRKKILEKKLEKFKKKFETKEDK
ncbi:MAG: hypothetical protein ACTSVV_13315 [Promethearchaeota archaeon]